MTGSEFVAQIDEILKQRNLKRQALFDNCGINTSALNDWTRRGTIPSADIVQRIADFLGVSDRWLTDDSYTAQWTKYDDGITTTGVKLSPRAIMRRIEIRIRDQQPEGMKDTTQPPSEVFFSGIVDIISFNQIQSAYQNRYNPTTVQLYEISNRLRVSVGWLLSGYDKWEETAIDRFLLGVAQDNSDFLRFFCCLPTDDQQQISNLAIYLFHSRKKTRDALIDKNIPLDDIPGLIQ